MNSVRAIAAANAASPRHSAEPEPVPVSALRASVDYRGEAAELRAFLQAERLRSDRLRGTALRLAWAMQGMCKALEAEGIDTTYWRDLATEAEAKAR